MSTEDELQGNERYEGPLWQILRGAYLRGILGPDRAARASEAEQNAALDAYFRDMETDLAQIMIVVSQAQSDQLEVVRAGLHNAPGVDHEMIDQSLAYALEP